MPIKYRESTIGYLITDGLKNKKNPHSYCRLCGNCYSRLSFFNLNLSIILSVVYTFGLFSQFTIATQIYYKVRIKIKNMR